MHANSPAATSEGAGTATVAKAQEDPSSAAVSMPATPSEQQGPDDGHGNPLDDTQSLILHHDSHNTFC